MVFELIAGGLVKAALPKVAGAIATAVKNKLNPTELEKALKVGLQKSGAFDREQKVNNTVFYRCTDKDADTFLAALLDHPEVQRELQKPLEQDGASDVTMLVQAAKPIAADRNLSIQDETLEPWLKALANAYFEAITAIRFQVAKADYLEQLANWFDDVKFAGVAVPGQDVERAERLAQIFVMPDVEEEGRRGLGIEGLRVWGDEGVTEDRQSQLLQEQRMRSQLERSGRKFSARQLLQQHQKKIVLLGALGSGKTTLMSFLAVTLAEQQRRIAITNDAHAKGLDRSAQGIDAHTEGIDRDRSRMVPDTDGLFAATQPLPLPILIRIRDWALHPDQSIPEYARQFAEKTMHVKPLPKGFFEHWLNNGQALIFLDGLDEVAEPSKRHHLVQCIENFLGQYPLNRAIITSRPAGYRRDFFRTEEFPHYELQPFDDQKIEEFCDRWYTSRVQDTAEAQRRKESLQKALNQQDRIKLLARNPLLLTIIALIHRYQARLPRERYKLYDKAVETLLTSWDDNKELSNQTVLKYLQLDDLRRLMEHLAYWIHTQGHTGDAEGGTLIDKDELTHQLTQEIKTLKQLQLYEAKEEAKRFVEFIRDRTGLLNEQGQDCYAFVHKTFQEYLTAQEINYQADNEDDFELVLTHIEQHLHDPHWREVLLLLIAQQSPKKAARAIRKVLAANSPYEQWLHRDVLFAGRCLAEDPKGLRGADTDLSSEILDVLVELEIRDVNQIGYKVREQVLQTFCSLYETDFEAEALQLLEKQAKFVTHYRLWQYRASLGQEDVVRSYLLERIQMKNAETIPEVTFLGASLEEALKPLLKTLKQMASDQPPSELSKDANGTTESNSDLWYASTELGWLMERDDTTESNSGLEYVRTNLELSMEQKHLMLLNNENSYIRHNASKALAESGKTHSWILPNLVQWIEQHQDEACVGAGIDALWAIVDGKG